MNILSQIGDNPIFMASLYAWAIAQILKVLIHLFLTKKFVMERFVGSGGMPSSHSSTVCALATSTGIIYGYSGFPFAMAAAFAIITMHDASGVRREAGNHAKILNEIMGTFLRTNSTMSSQERLKEFVGHTPLQVFAGALLGIVVALAYCL